MAEQSPDGTLIKIVGPLIGAAIGGAAGWLPDRLSAIDPALTAILAAVGGIAGVAFSLMYKRYVGVLGAGGRPKGSGSGCIRQDAGEPVWPKAGVAHLRRLVDQVS